VFKENSFVHLVSKYHSVIGVTTEFIKINCSTEVNINVAGDKDKHDKESCNEDWNVVLLV